MKTTPKPLIGQTRKIAQTSKLLHQNEYTLALQNELSQNAFSEERAPLNRGKWREILGLKSTAALDLELGTGNGFYFAHHAQTHPDRGLVGIELKYKPLVQSIRRALKAGCKNAAICRYHIFDLADLFSENEVDDIIIHFPDPWTNPRKPRNRIVNRELLKTMESIQRPGGIIEFKTDSREYFDWALEELKESPFQVFEQTYDLHGSEYQPRNFITAFEKIFLNKGIKINYLRAKVSTNKVHER